jgi:hypothetical protein
MHRKPRTLALLSTLAVLVAGVSASAASAAINFEWKVNGATLPAESSKQIVAKANAANSFHILVHYAGTALELTSSQVKFASGATIVGGKPGTGKDSLVFESVKVAKPANCTVKESGPEGLAETLRTSLKSEIVEGAKGGNGIGTVDLKLVPTAGNIWTGFEFTGTGCPVKGVTGLLEGSLLVEVGPQKAEAKVGLLTFEAKTKEYKPATGLAEEVKLESFGKPATLIGGVETELTSKEAFGAF